MNMHIDPDMLRETRDRARRIETRLTKLALAMGVNPGAEKPHWDNGSIVVPSRECSISDIFVAVPIDWPSDQEIEVVIGDELLGFYRPPSVLMGHA